MTTKGTLPRVFLVLLIFLAGCAQELTGPAPLLVGEHGADSPEDSVLWPGFACAEQTEQWFELRGEAFSPLVVETLVDPAVEYPSVVLRRVASVEGTVEEDPGESGDDEDGHPLEVRLDASDDEDSRVRWVDENLLQIRISEDLALEPGTYSLEVINPNGNAVLAEEAFGVLHRPVVTQVEPELTCLEQGERAILVSGDHFLYREDSLPTVIIDDVSYVPEEASYCRNLSTPFGSFQLCRELRVMIPAQSHEAGDRLAVSVLNGGPQSANCASLPDEDGVELVTVPAPVLHGVQPDPICGEQVEYESYRLSGAHFISFAAQGSDEEALLPTVTIGDVTFTAHTLEDCVPVEGVVRADVQSCSELLLQIPAGALSHLMVELPERELIEDAAQLFTLLGVSVENPAPAGCTSTQDVELRLMPAPRVDLLGSNPVCVAQDNREITIFGAGFMQIDAALPTVHVGEQSYPADGVDGCLAIGDDGTLSCSMVTFTMSEGDFAESGNYEVAVTNPQHAHCTSQQLLQVTVVPPPQVALVEPEPVCVEDGERLISIEGTGFLSLDGRLPTVHVGTESYPAAAVDNCQPLEMQPGSGVDAHECSELTFVIPQNDLPAGPHQVSVTNPDTAGCTSEEEVEYLIVPAPDAQAIEDNPACVREDARSFVVTGHDFLVIDGVMPQISVSDQLYAADSVDGCEPVAPLDERVERCGQISFSMPQDDLSPGLYQVAALNPMPAGCESPQDLPLLLTPKPQLASVAPSAVCQSGQSVDLILTGSGFVTVDDQRPMVHIDDQALQADAADDCEESGLAGVLICQSLSVAVPSQAFAPGRYGVMVTNTAPAGCSTSEPVLVSFAPAPQVSGVVPEIVCTEDGTVNLTVSGEDFLRVGAALPSIVIGSADYPAVSATCEATPFLDDGDNVVHRCTELEVAITETALVPDVYQVAVKNPAPYDCIGLEQTSPILVTGAPVVDETEPDVICRGQFDDGRMTLVGRGFLTIDGAHPEVLVNQVAGEDIVVPEDYCDALEGLNYTILGCRRLEFTVPQALRDGDLDISLSNPAPAQCMAAEYQFTMNETPHIDDVQPEKVCYLGGDLRLWGEFFEEGMAVDLDGTAARTVLLSNNGTQALATFGEVEAGLRTLTATNPSGCAESYDTNIRVTNGPVPFFVDPAVAYNQLSLQITVYLGNLYGGSVEEVIITDSQGTSTPLGGLSFDPQRPTQVQALLPAGLPADTYSVTLVDEVDCPGTGENLLVITDQAEVMVTGIQPPFGWTESSTGVTISSDPQAPAEQQFAATPRVYINPSEAAQGVTARELRASTFVSSVELNGIVASGFEPGLYDIIVLNPDGGVGVLEAGFRVTQEPPPLIGSVSPGSWSNKDNITLTISGQFFRDNLDVVVECRNSASPAVNITGVTAETVTATVNTGGLAHLDVCAIRVINDDTSYDEFSPITVTNPASNFISLRSATDLDHPRRKPAVSSGVPSRGQRFVYVIGGDDGQESNAFASGRFCVTDRFGTPQQWQALPYDLPAGRTLSRAFRIGDFVYVAGGYAVVEAGVDEGASADVLRAHVVDPLHVVEINDVNLQIEDGVGGLEEGVYYYRVAVVLDEDDDANPLGETLASDPQPIRIPDIQEGVHVNIGWDAFPNAQRYRIYRSEAADVPYGNEMLIAEVATDSFTDNGSLAVDPSLRPMTLGSLGRWHKVAELNEARFNHGLAVAADPVTEDRHIIFMVGGENDVAAMASIEHLVVDVDGPQQQQVSPVGIPNLVSLAAPTTRLEAVVANRNNASLFPDDRNFLIAYGGMDSGGVTGRVLATEVSADGLLDPFTSLTTMSQTHSGFVGLVANNFIIALYGNNGQPNNGAHRAILCGEGCAFPPTINVGNSSWKSMGNVAGRDRHLPGHTLLRGFLYVAGGLTSGSVPTATVDFSPIGSP